MTPPRKGDAQPGAVYRLFAAAERLLYIGSSIDPEQRWVQLASTEAWWQYVSHRAVEWHPTRTDALEAEVAAIRSEDPLLNLQGVGGRRQRRDWQRRWLDLPDGTRVPLQRIGQWCVGYRAIADGRADEWARRLRREVGRRPTSDEARIEAEWAAELASAGYPEEAARAKIVASAIHQRWAGAPISPRLSGGLWAAGVHGDDALTLIREAQR